MFVRLARAAVIVGCLSPAVVACSSSSSQPASGTTTTAASSTSLATASGTAAPLPSTTSEVFSAEKLPVQQALGVLRQLFVVGGLDPDDQHTASIRLRSCPLGQPEQLTATPPALIAGLGASAIATLNRSRGPLLDVICRFSTNQQNGATPSTSTKSTPTKSTPADAAVPEVQYDASSVLPAQLKAYLRFLDDRGFVQQPDRFLDGVVYSSCTATAGSPTTVGTTSSSCSALWYFRQLVVGVQFSGPGKPVDVTPWLTSVVEPIVRSLAKTDPASVEVPTPTTVAAGTTTTSR